MTYTHAAKNCVIVRALTIRKVQAARGGVMQKAREQTLTASVAVLRVRQIILLPLQQVPQCLLRKRFSIVDCLQMN